jgi:hypothetical protein
VAQAKECLLCTCKTLSSKSSPTKKFVLVLQLNLVVAYWPETAILKQAVEFLGSGAGLVLPKKFLTILGI